MMNRDSDKRSNWKEDRIFTWTNEGEEPAELMQFVLDRMKDHKRSDVKIWLKYGHITLNGNVTRQFNAPVEPGDRVQLNIVRPFPEFHNRRLSIVYEDDDIIVVNKGYGLLSVATDSNKKDETAYSILRDYVKRKHPSNKIFVVHRLDRQTSGLMMFAKNIEAQEAMQHNWNNMVLDRKYVAVLDGVVEEDSGVIRSNLEENSQFKVYSTRLQDAGKPATTRYKVLERGSKYSLVEFSLDTGRKNQIRVHAQDLGHPITGDKKYGGKAGPLHRLALHARSLRFAHPRTRRDMHFELPIPSKFVGVVRHS